MAITFPRADILTAANFTDPEFDLVSRQELSRQASGVTRGKDLGSAIWVATFTTVPMQTADAVAYEAMLNSLDGVINTFELHDIRRPYPRAHSDGSFADAGSIHSIGAGSKSMRVDGLAAGFTLSVGDYLAFDYGSSRALHQVMEEAVADGSGLTPEFEVRPHIRAGADGSPSPAVTLKKPSGLFTLMPGSISRPRRGPPHTTISFKAVQYL